MTLSLQMGKEPVCGLIGKGSSRDTASAKALGQQGWMLPSTGDRASAQWGQEKRVNHLLEEGLGFTCIPTRALLGWCLGPAC